MRKLYAVAFLCLPVAAQIPGGGVGGRLTPLPNVELALSAEANSSTKTFTHNLNTTRVIVQCLTTAGARIDVTIPEASRTVNALDVVFPGSGGPFSGKCFANGTGTGSAGAAGAPGPINTIEDPSGTPAPTRDTVQFLGNVTVADVGGTKTTVTVTGPADAVGGASALDTPDAVPVINSGGVLTKLSSLKRNGSGSAERIQIWNNAGGATGLDLRIGTQGTTPIMRVLNADGSCCISQWTFAGRSMNSVGVVVNTGATENAALDPTRGIIVANNRGFWFSNTPDWWTTIDTGFEKVSPGVIRAAVSPGGARATLQFLNGDVSGTLTVSNFAGTALGTQIQPFSNNLLGFAGKTAPVGAVVGTSDAQDLFAKTVHEPVLIDPVIAGDEFGDAQHTHASAAAGGQLTDAALSAPVTPAKGGLGVAGTLTGVPKLNGMSPAGIVTGNATDCVLVNGTSGTCGSGGGSLVFQQNGIPFATRSTVDAVDGLGLTRIQNDTGTKITDQISLNTAVAATRLQVQSGADHVVEPTSSGTDNYVGALSPAITAYPTTNGMRIMFRPNFTSSGATDLALNGLSALPIYESDGTTNAALVSGQWYQLVFDTTGADLWRKPASAGGSVTNTNVTGTVAGLSSVTCDASSAGKVYHFTDASYIEKAICDGVSAWHYYMKGKRVYPVTAATFTSAVGSGTTSDTGLAVKHVGVTDAAHNITGAFKAVPGSTYSVTVAFVNSGARHVSGFPGCGLAWRDSASGKLEVFPESSIFTIGSTTGYTMTSPTAGFTGVSMSAESPVNAGDVIWYRFNRNGSNRQLYWSRDGINFRLAHQEGITTAHFAAEPNQWGIVCNPRVNTTILPEMLLISALEGAAF